MLSDNNQYSGQASWRTAFVNHDKSVFWSWWRTSAVNHHKSTSGSDDTPIWLIITTVFWSWWRTTFVNHHKSVSGPDKSDTNPVNHHNQYSSLVDALLLWIITISFLVLVSHYFDESSQPVVWSWWRTIFVNHHSVFWFWCHTTLTNHHSQYPGLMTNCSDKSLHQ